MKRSIELVRCSSVPAILAGDQQQHAEAAELVVDILDAVIDRVGIAADEEAVVDQLLEGEIGIAAAGRYEMLHAAMRMRQIGAVQFALGLRHGASAT